MERITKIKKLVLQSETLRNLSTGDVAHVIAGADGPGNDSATITTSVKGGHCVTITTIG